MTSPAVSNALAAETLLQEIREQPNIWAAWIDSGQNGLETQLSPPSPETRQIIAFAEGSSFHALMMAAPYLRAWTGLPVTPMRADALESQLVLTETTELDSPKVFQHTYFIAVSQSGETACILKLLESLKQQLWKGLPKDALPLLGLTNGGRSTLVKHYPNTLLLDCGQERSIPATKTLSASFLTLLLWGLWVGQKRRVLTKAQVARIGEDLATLPTLGNAMLEREAESPTIHAFARNLDRKRPVVLLSKGPLTAILPEVALKLTEVAERFVYVQNTESFKHGPKVLLDGRTKRSPSVVYLVPPEPLWAEPMYQDLVGHFQGIHRPSHQPVFFVTFENSPPLPKSVGKKLDLSQAPTLVLPAAPSELASLFLGLLAFQLISHARADITGDSPNHPALAKAVTT